MSDLQEQLDVFGPDYDPEHKNHVYWAARKYQDIHPSRLHEWHILHVRAGSWSLTHPLICDLTNCAYQDQAETWRDQPDELGNYQWEHEPALESWTALDITSEDTE